MSVEPTPKSKTRISQIIAAVILYVVLFGGIAHQFGILHAINTLLVAVIVLGIVYKGEKSGTPPLSNTELTDRVIIAYMALTIFIAGQFILDAFYKYVGWL